MKLNLKNPIVFFDLETTGTNINTDRIVEICYLKVYPNGNEETKTMRINPEMHIPEQSSAIHGIYDADVADCPTFKEVAKEIARDIEGCDLAGFNSNRFDIPVLAEEFLRAGVDIDMMKRKFIDVQVIYHKLEQRTLSAAYKFYCGKNLEDAHTAEADTRATYEVLKSQLDRYPEELQNDMAFLAEYSSFNKNVDFAGRIVYDDKGVEVFNFGKYKGMSVSEVLQKDPGYYSWILNGDFTLNTKNVLTKIRLREMSMKGKKIVLGITGSIAAYKAAILIRGLIKKGAEVQVVITPAGKEFITPITLSALTSKPVISEFFAQRDGTWNSHVDLGLWADAMIIAPATASTIGKMANGIADNMLITTYLSMKAPVFVAPAMDLDMFAHPSTRKNLDTLRSYGNHIIEPAEGELASHLVGKGRMEEPEKIVEILEAFFAKQQDMAGKKVVITAGPTYEKIDPVRFIGNYSSGKMGFALAEECASRGAEVSLISGPVTIQAHHPNIRRIDVESAGEMYEAAIREFPTASAGILCAAVADFTPETVAGHKIKREKDNLTLQLKPTQDIAAALGNRKKDGQTLVGFALETNDETKNAQRKLERKNLDFIVLNSLNDQGAGFRCDTNKITIIDRQGATPYPLKSKQEVARDIIDRLVNNK